ncbi:unnamed protein product [Kuraishia capsulata CBS 1993]|uniref:Thioredoxin peroxidase n=1 Tax=Kuraishia capsulata CBS 1993 TaxID=1382522 RepID=W6MR53_9ASCO|nr:uncharacterized protein KUCA_T00003701001 [Kuraishia capsulata CBS 1993]CDK27722.1 unnamed protein product [Kuraishia capsulata CBS 1993]
MVSVGDSFPTDVKLQYIPWSEENAGVLACSIPIPYDLEKKLPGRTVVFVAVPGAFTPTCTANHIPPFVEKIGELKAKGVDDVVILSANDAFVQAAWGKALGAKDELIFASDPLASLSAELGFTLDLSSNGFGIRTGRYAAIVKDGKITYLSQEPGAGVTVSGFDTVLAALN